MISLKDESLKSYLDKKGFIPEDLFKAGAVIADAGELYYTSPDYDVPGHPEFSTHWTEDKSGIMSKDFEDKELSVLDIINNKLQVYKASGCNAAIFVPIFSLQQQLIGMSIRKMHDTSKHDSWFKPGCRKVDTVYGLNTAFKDIVMKQSIILTEGVYDAIALRKYGFTQTCALLGTHMSNLQFFQIASITKNICLCLDNDEAGITACQKIVDTYKKIYGDDVQFFKLVLDKDPDEFLKEKGPDELKRRLQKC